MSEIFNLLISVHRTGTVWLYIVYIFLLTANAQISIVKNTGTFYIITTVLTVIEWISYVVIVNCYESHNGLTKLSHSCHLLFWKSETWFNLIHTGFEISLRQLLATGEVASHWRFSIEYKYKLKYCMTLNTITE